MSAVTGAEAGESMAEVQSERGPGSVSAPETDMEGVADKKASGLADSLDGKMRALPVADVAELLNISERQVYKLVSEYRIPSFKIGGSIRFDPCAVAVWLRQKMALACMGSTGERKRGV
jgi:excisionase family DNA binding protein